MAIDSRVIGRRVTITCDGTKTIWDTLRVKYGRGTEDATASDSDDDEVVRTTKLLDCELVGFLGFVNNAGTLPDDGDEIDDFNVETVENDALLPDFSSYSNIKVIQPQYDFQKGPAKFTLPFRSGVLN